MDGVGHKHLMEMLQEDINTRWFRCKTKRKQETSCEDPRTQLPTAWPQWTLICFPAAQGRGALGSCSWPLTQSTLTGTQNFSEWPFSVLGNQMWQVSTQLFLRCSAPVPPRAIRFPPELMVLFLALGFAILCCFTITFLYWSSLCTFIVYNDYAISFFLPMQCF